MDPAFPIVCTAVSASRLEYASVLGRAVERLHGEQAVVLVVGGISSEIVAPSGVELRFPDDLSITSAEFHALALCVSEDDLASSLAPTLLEKLLSESPDRAVVFLAPETVLLSGLDELTHFAMEGSVAIGRRCASPLPQDGKSPTPQDLIDAGNLEASCVAVAQGAGAFLAWWREQLDLYANIEGAHASIAQPFLDVASTFFSLHEFSSPQYGVSRWNAHEHLLTYSDELGYHVDGAPIRTANLAGFDPNCPSVLAPSDAHLPRVLLSENPVLAQLCHERANELLSLRGVATSSPSTYRVLADGSLLDDRMIRLIRRARARSGAERVVPDPFDKATLADFFAWLASPDPENHSTPMVPRYLFELWLDRKDLQWHFPRLDTVDAPQFREWVGRHGLDEEGLTTGLCRALTGTSWWSAPTGVVAKPPRQLRPGVTFAGYLQSSIGVGEAGRLVLSAMERAGIEAEAILARDPSALHATRSQDSLIADRAVNAIWVNADQLFGFASIVGPEFFDGRYNIGGWVWETERLPKQMAQNSELLDEIWVPSEFVRAGVEPFVDRPVHLFPYPLGALSPAGPFDRAAHGVGEGFMFLFSFDFLSSFRRKNPLGLIEAYRQAFPREDEAVLVIKSVNGNLRLPELEQLRLAASSRADIVVIDARFDEQRRAALFEAASCYVSLHRSEGFGLGLAEAMSLGKPTIATGYSGNLDFMTEDCSYLVSASRVAVGEGAPPYESSAIWAEPDLGEAATYLRRVYEDQTGARELGLRAKAHIADLFAAERSTQFLRGRMAAIEEMRAKGHRSTAADAIRRRL